MGLYPQPNDWTCGPFALKHALAALGRIADEDTIKNSARSHWWSGTDEINLARAARAYECDLVTVRSRTSDIARKRLLAQLRKRVPVLLCVDDWGHWITVVRYEAKQFVIIDSDLDPVLNVVTWPQLCRRWKYLDVDYDEEDPPALFDMYPVVPRFHVSIKAAFSVSRARHLRKAENRALAESWSEYLEDLLEVCRPPAPRMVKPLSMAEFLRRNQDLVINRVCFWYGDVDRKLVAKLLANYRLVAETYGLVVPAAKARRAVTDLSILATLWVTAARGVAPMYGVGGDNG